MSETPNEAAKRILQATFDDIQRHGIHVGNWTDILGDPDDEEGISQPFDGFGNACLGGWIVFHAMGEDSACNLQSNTVNTWLKTFLENDEAGRLIAKALSLPDPYGKGPVFAITNFSDTNSTDAILSEVQNALARLA